MGSFAHLVNGDVALSKYPFLYRSVRMRSSSALMKSESSSSGSLYLAVLYNLEQDVCGPLCRAFASEPHVRNPASSPLCVRPAPTQVLLTYGTNSGCILHFGRVSSKIHTELARIERSVHTFHYSPQAFHTVPQCSLLNAYCMQQSGVAYYSMPHSIWPCPDQSL